MLTPFERLMAFRYLRARRAEGFISVIAGFSLAGIALGVATLIVVLSVMRGVRGEMIESIIGLEGHITVNAAARGIPAYDALAQDIRAQGHIQSAIPIIQGQVMLTFAGQSGGAMVTGLRASDLAKKPLLASKLSASTVAEFEASGGVLIGSRMAERMGISVGDSITLISPQGRYTPAGMVPRIQAYPVSGIFNIGMFAYDNGLVVMPFDAAQVYFKLAGEEGGRASALEVMTDAPEDAGTLAQQLQAKLGAAYRVYDWKSSNSHILNAVLVQRNVFFLILMLIIIVASFNIIASLVMLVREKSRDIAILRTMGASRKSVMTIFITCGASIGFVGTALGVALGLLIALNTEAIQHFIERASGQKLLANELYFLSSLPAKVDAGEVAFVVLVSLALSLLATIYPARKAAKLDPAECLRYE